MLDDYDFTMIVGKGCSHCADAKEGLKEHITNGKIRVLDIATDKDAMDLADKYNIDAVPSIIVNNKATLSSEVCELKGDLTGVICKGKEVKF